RGSGLSGPRALLLDPGGETAMATQTSLSKDEILDAIGHMSVFDLAELIEAFKTKFGVTIVAAPAAAPGGAAGGAAGAAGAAAPGEGERGGTVSLEAGGEEKSQVTK